MQRRISKPTEKVTTVEEVPFSGPEPYTPGEIGRNLFVEALRLEERAKAYIAAREQQARALYCEHVHTDLAPAGGQPPQPPLEAEARAFWREMRRRP